MTGDNRPLIFLGVDIGKSAHYAVVVDRDGQTVYSKPVANEESTLRLLVLSARVHQAAVIVDQPGGTAALLLKLCWDATNRYWITSSHHARRDQQHPWNRQQRGHRDTAR